MVVAGTTVEVARYLPFLDGPRPAGQDDFRWRLGVRPLDLRDWIELGPDADAAIAAKDELNRTHPSTVFASLDDVEAEAQEAADALVGHLRTRWPERYAGATLRPDLHPLDAVARLVPEDLVLMTERPDSDGTPRLVFAAGSVCFPNRWDLRSKIGLPLRAVHAPVAQLNDQLALPIDRFFERLTPDKAFWRLGWGVLDTPDWYTPLDGTAAPRPDDPQPADLFLRVERETLRRFPRTGAVLFTIRTYLTAIPNVLGDRLVAERLMAALDALPDDVRTYKDLVHYVPAMVAAYGGTADRS